MNKTVGAAIIFVASLAAYVILATFAPTTDYRGVFIFAATGAAWLGLTDQNDKVKRKAAETAEVVQKIHKQTNGVLDERIQMAVKKALEEMFEKHDKEKVHTVVVTKTNPPTVRKRRLPKVNPKGEN